MKPIISIIVPIYNVEKYLPKCIESILNQTFKEFELILVDDGSPDNSGSICDEYSKKDERIKVIHKENGGVSSARNVGLGSALGEYIGFVDPDDYINEDMFEVLYNLCISTNSDIAICKNSREINGEIYGTEDDIYTKIMDTDEALKEMFKANLYRFALWNKICKKKCFYGIRFPEGRVHEDLSATYKIIANSSKVIFTNYVGYIYVKRDESILTKKYNKNRLQSFIGWDEIFRFFNKNYVNLKVELLNCYTYWCIDNIYYILNQITNTKQAINYLKVLRGYMDKYYYEIINNKSLGIKDKYMIILLKLNIPLTIQIYKIKLKIS